MVKKQNESLGKVGTPPRKTTSKATKSKNTVKNSSKQRKHNLCSGSIEVPVVSAPVVLVFDQMCSSSVVSTSSCSSSHIIAYLCPIIIFPILVILLHFMLILKFTSQNHGNS